MRKSQRICDQCSRVSQHIPVHAPPRKCILRGLFRKSLFSKGVAPSNCRPEPTASLSRLDERSAGSTPMTPLSCLHHHDKQQSSPTAEHYSSYGPPQIIPARPSRRTLSSKRKIPCIGRLAKLAFRHQYRPRRPPHSRDKSGIAADTRPMPCQAQAGRDGRLFGAGVYVGGVWRGVQGTQRSTQRPANRRRSGRRHPLDGRAVASCSRRR